MSQPSETPEPTPPSAPEAPTAEVLVIDDEPYVRAVLEKALRKEGYTVCSATNGKTALGALAAQNFKLVITDIFMPDMDGYEIIMKINARTPKPQVLAISGGAMNLAGEALRTAKLLGCKGVLAKPFDLAEIYAAVRSLIGPPAAKAAQ